MRSTSIKKMRFLIGISLLLLIGISGFNLPAKDKIDPKLWEKAKKIHQEAIVIDTHCDTPMVLRHRKLDLGQKTDKNEVDFIRMKQGGLDAIFFAVFVSNRLDDKHPAKNALEMIDEIFLQVEKYPGLAQMAFSPQDIRDIHKQGKRAILIGIENGGPIEESLGILRNFYRLGVRYITLTHNSNNAICDSSSDEKPKWNGLSPFGKEVVKEMNRLGMLIDVSHISDKAFWDVIEVSEAPVFASHSCVRSLCDVPRNMTDEMIKALAKKGGVIQINFFSAFLDEAFKRKSEETRKKLEPQIKKLRETYKDDRGAFWSEIGRLWKEHGPEPPGIEALIDHIDHVVKLAGVDYVGLGSDYDGAGSFPKGLEDVTGYPLITYRLLKRGYKEEDIKKILGGNFLRFFEEVIRAAKHFDKNKK
ncbi:MAG: membrane dipeptidase [Candidatus Aminicenantes bacterium]|nr:membrane dipeptidase [Candidatus Aminicenantes bacterium]NIM79725.1 membrane dipeptidase [Candidatus Aminicenantes bacterium]NIN19056.1 membrane dipeptidase [Candidatus Aminicenantes bacterium]NIN42958.1 membrane dipeptidase [Candidatus Aminicenantes bacterium]NIN85701.1 membrane dipeptidase [Candidatus Aminicenantes bacterium]